MNQICHFGFIRQFAPTLCLLFWIAAIPIGEVNCFAQEEMEPRSYRSQWTVRQQSTQANRETNNFPHFGSQVVETSFSEPLAATQSPSTPQVDTPGSKASSALSNITNFFSSQTKNLFGKSTVSNGPDFKRIIGSLCLVLGCYFALVWILRMIAPPTNKALPSDVVEVLGKTPFGNRQHLQLVRIGSRLLLLLESHEVIQPIAEVSDPEEVHLLLSLCEKNSRAGRRQRSKPTRNRSSEPEPQVHSLRIPAVNTRDSDRYPNDESDSAALASLLRVFENATGKKSSRYKSSYEA